MTTKATPRPAGIVANLPYLFALLFVVLGTGMIGVLGIGIATNPELDPMTFFGFIDTYGLILPVIVITLGLFFVWIGLRMFNRDINAAQWARTWLLWIVVGLLLWGVQIVVTIAAEEVEETAMVTLTPDREAITDVVERLIAGERVVGVAPTDTERTAALDALLENETDIISGIIELENGDRLLGTMLATLNDDYRRVIVLDTDGNTVNAEIRRIRNDIPVIIREVTPVLIAAVLLGAAWWLLGRNLDQFAGKTRLAWQEARVAWNLLIPSAAILIIVAARPLEQTFIISLTDRRFGSAQEFEFIGFDNYVQLLGVRLDETPCVTGDDGECQMRTIESERTEVIDVEINPERVRETLVQLIAGESVSGVPRMIPPDELATLEPLLEQDADTLLNAMLDLQNGPLQLEFILAGTLDGLDVESVESIGDGVASVAVIRMDESEAIVYQTAADAAGETYNTRNYSPLHTYNLFGNRYVLSARDANFITAIENTLIFTVFSVTLELILGLFIALVVNSRFRGRGLMRTAMLVPWAIPTVISARLWETMLIGRQAGVINFMLNNLGVIDGSQAWLANPDLQIPAMIAIDVWKTTPFMALILLAGLQVIPKELYEAARVDGAGRVRSFLSITLPLLRPTIAVGLIFRTLDALRVFDIFQLLLGRQQLSMATYNYETLITNQQFGYASAIGVVIFMIILLFTILYVNVLGLENES